MKFCPWESDQGVSILGGYDLERMFPPRFSSSSSDEGGGVMAAVPTCVGSGGGTFLAAGVGVLVVGVVGGVVAVAAEVFAVVAGGGLLLALWTVRWCLTSRSCREKQLVHLGHSKGFSLVWERSWRLRCSRRANDREHERQVRSFGLRTFLGRASARAVLSFSAICLLLGMVVDGLVEVGTSLALGFTVGAPGKEQSEENSTVVTWIY